MASPTKNLVDATSLTIIAYYEQYLVQKSIYSAPISPILNNFLDTTLIVPRWSLVNTINNFNTVPTELKVPLISLGRSVDIASNTIIATFPPIYKERTGSRPTEGQIYPRGFK